MIECLKLRFIAAGADCKFATKYANTKQCRSVARYAATIVFTSGRQWFKTTATNFTTTKWYSTTHSIATRASIPHAINHAKCTDQEETGGTAGEFPKTSGKRHTINRLFFFFSNII